MQTTQPKHIISIPNTQYRCYVEMTNSNHSRANVIVTTPVGGSNLTFTLAEIDQGYTDLWSIFEIALEELQPAFTMRSFPTFSGVARYLYIKWVEAGEPLPKHFKERNNETS